MRKEDSVAIEMLAKLVLLAIVSFGVVSASSQVKWHEKVNITLYYESLCPDCHSFINEQLVPTYHKMRKYFNVWLIPYGNAKDQYNNKTRKWETECQHGPEECKGNKMAACAIYLLKNETNIVNFIGCLTTSFKPDTVVQKCATKVNLKYPSLKQCYTGAKGDSLQLHYGNITHRLKPKLQWVPTVTINNVFNETEQDLITKDLPTALCNHIKDPKPYICKKSET